MPRYICDYRCILILIPVTHLVLVIEPETTKLYGFVDPEQPCVSQLLHDLVRRVYLLCLPFVTMLKMRNVSQICTTPAQPIRESEIILISSSTKAP